MQPSGDMFYLNKNLTIEGFTFLSFKEEKPQF